MSPRTRAAGWGLADQLVASGSNLAVGLAAARALDPAEFGAFAIVFSVYLLALSTERAAIAQPMIARSSHVAPEAWRGATRAATGTAVVLGVAFAAVLVVVALVVGGTLEAGLLVLAVALPGLLLQDALRYTLVADGRSSWTFGLDAIWAALALPPLLVLALLHPVPLAWLVVAWGGAGVVAGLAGIFALRLLPAPRSVGAWIREHRDLLPALVGGSLLEVGGQTLTTAGIGAIAGLPAAGAIRAGQLLLSPANVLYQAVALVTPPEAARLARTAPARIPRYFLRIGALVVGAIAVSAVVVLLVPREIGREILEANWDGGSQVVPLLAIAMAGQVFAFAAGATLLVLTAMRRAFRMSVLTALALTVTQLAGASASGPVGVATALAIMYPALAVVGWGFALMTIRERVRAGVAASSGAAGGAGAGGTAADAAEPITPA